MRIAILGCTGQIGRCLVRALALEYDLFLYARRPEAMQTFLADWQLPARVQSLEEFADGRFDLIINAIGDGVPGKIRAAGDTIRQVTETFDRQCLDHLERNPECAYIFLSTGRIYGAAYEGAQREDPLPLPEADLADHPYPLAKLAAESRHRDRSDLKIADIRIFGFVSDQIGLEDDFLLSEILQAVLDQAAFLTTGQDFIRDFVGPEDLAELIDCLVRAGIPNGAYDLFSAAPLTKFSLLDALACEFGLDYRVGEPRLSCGPVPQTITLQDAAGAIGYRPLRSSLDNVIATANALVQGRRGSIKAS